MATTDPGELSAETIQEVPAAYLHADHVAELARLDEAIAVADDATRGSLLLERAIAQQGEADPSVPAADGVRAFELLVASARSDEAALAAAVSGAMMQRAGDIEAAVDYAVEAMALVNVAEQSLVSARAANSIAILFGQLSAFEQAFHYSSLSSDICAQIGEPPPLAVSYSACWVTIEAHHVGIALPLARAHTAQKLLADEASPIARRMLAPAMAAELSAIEDPERIGRHRLDDTMLDEAAPRVRAWYELVLAMIAHANGDHERTVELVSESIPTLTTLGDDHRVVRAYRLRSDARSRLGDMTGALDDATTVADIVRKWQVDQVGRLSVQISRRVELEQKQSSLQRRAVDLVRQINIDELTKIGSRRLLEARFDSIEQQSGSVSIAVLDIDEFKLVNDQYGHATGDAILAVVGDALRSAPQPWSVLARYGGDEFVAAFTEPGTDEARAFASHVMAALEQTDWDVVSPGLEIHLSVGIAAGASGDVRSVLERADDAMYAAKRAGRNRYVVA